MKKKSGKDIWNVNIKSPLITVKDIFSGATGLEPIIIKSTIQIINTFDETQLQYKIFKLWCKWDL